MKKKFIESIKKYFRKTGADQKLNNFQKRNRRFLSLARQIRDNINNLLFTSRERVFKSLRIFNLLNLVVAIFFLIFTFGFHLNQEQIDQIYQWLQIAIVLFVLDYFIRLVYSFKRWEFVIENSLESSLIGIFLLFNISEFLGVSLSYGLFDVLGLQDYNLFYEFLISIYLIIFIIIRIAEASTLLSDIQVKPAATFIASFILLIMLGTGFLMMPAMTHKPISFLDALFTSTSASCVTGLAVQDTATFFTFKGQLVILVLLQVGGIGIVSFASFFATFLSQGVGIKQQAIIQDVMSSESLSSAKDMLKRVVWLTVIIELIGAIAIFFTWNPDVPFKNLGEKLFFSLFHSISAFCNAGFSLYSNGLNEVFVNKSYIMHFVIMLIITLGSLGFTAIEDIFSIKKLRERLDKPWKEWSLSTQIAVNMTIFLTIMGAVGFYFIEVRPKNALEGAGVTDAIIVSLFQSVTTRTAGFNTIDFGILNETTLILMIFLMFIGAAPGSTGGGIKTSTFLLLVVSAVASIRGKKTVEIGKRSIPADTISKAFSIVAFAITYNFVCFFILSLTQPVDGDKVTILTLFFEQVSAFATVGLSTGITGDLTPASKVIIILSMYIGRVGTVTLAFALSKKVISTSYQYPTAHVMVG